MKEEASISAGTPPTNSVGTGVETSLPPASEPPGIPRGSKIIKRKPKKKIYENETQVRTKLREYLRNTGGIINIQRIFATDVIDFYTTKRAKAMKRLPDVVLEMNGTSIPNMAPMDNNPQAAKQDQAKKTQAAKQDAQKRVQLAKQNMQKQLQQKKIEMQRNLQNQQKTLQQRKQDR
jgi:hypothetical protein